MKPAMLLGILLFVVFAAIGVYYLIPMSTAHILASNPNTSDVKHALLAFALAIISIVGGRIVAGSSASAR
jgi:hypothetical protein